MHCCVTVRNSDISDYGYEYVLYVGVGIGVGTTARYEIRGRVNICRSWGNEGKEGDGYKCGNRIPIGW